MLIVGGCVGEDICGRPGVYVFDISNLHWKSSFEVRSSHSVPQAMISSPSGQGNYSTISGDPRDAPSNSITPSSSNRSKFATSSIRGISLHSLPLLLFYQKSRVR